MSDSETTPGGEELSSATPAETSNVEIEDASPTTTGAEVEEDTPKFAEEQQGDEDGNNSNPPSPTPQLADVEDEEGNVEGETDTPAPTDEHEDSSTPVDGGEDTLPQPDEAEQTQEEVVPSTSQDKVEEEEEEEDTLASAESDARDDHVDEVGKDDSASAPTATGEEQPDASATTTDGQPLDAGEESNTSADTAQQGNEENGIDSAEQSGEPSRLNTAEATAIETEASHLVARVMSATDRRIRELQADSRPSTGVTTRTQSAKSTVSSLMEENTALTEERSREIVEAIMEGWTRSDTWKHCTKLVSQEEREDTARFSYNSIWSIPTRRRPIPNATASVYFTVCRTEDGVVRATYTLESQRLVHGADTQFREKWLHDILAAKRSFHGVLELG